MKKIRFFFRLITAFVEKHKKTIVLGFLAGVVFFILIPRAIQFLPKVKYVEKIGLVGHFKIEEIPLEIQEIASYGLTKLDKDGSTLAGLASSWTTEQEGKVYKFNLKSTFWQDKTPLKAQDINYNFKDVAVEVVDEKTIVFTLKEPFSLFPVIVSRPIFKKGLIGLGDYQIKKITKNGQYIESILLESSDINKPNIIYRFYPTEESAKIALKLNEVKKLKNISLKDGFEDWKYIKISSSLKLDQYVGVFFNTEKPFLEDKNFRQALSYAIEKPTLPDRALSPISPLSWAYNDEVKQYNYDFENAKKLMAKSLEGKDNKQIKIKMLTVPSLLREADKIKISWEKLGLKVDLAPFRSEEDDFDVLLVTQEIPSDPDQYSLWHSTQTSNITNFKNPRIDKLLEDGRKTLDKQERKRIYLDFQRFLVEENPVAFLYHPTVYDISFK